MRATLAIRGSEIPALPGAVTLLREDVNRGKRRVRYRLGGATNYRI